MIVKKRYVLIVDQQPIVQSGIAGLLDKDEYDITFAKNGEEGSAALQEKKYSLLIIDIYRQDWDCLEMIEITLKKYPSLNVILFTNISRHELLYT